MPRIRDISREQAIKAGVKYYFTGKKCPQGHITVRFVTSYGCKECHRLQLIKKRNLNPDLYKIKRKIYALKRPDILRRQRKKTREKYLEKYKERQRKYWRDRPEYRKMILARRRARKRNASGHHSAKDIRSLLEKQNFKCFNCLISIREIGYQVDHVMPLARGGSNDIANIQILCASCNYRKRAKDPFDFAREEGRLL